jgi:DNA helicase IV
MSYFFELPLITDLTEDQQMALDELKSIAISGGAGTGKTVVSLWRHIQNMETSNKYSVIVTYTKTLGHYLSMSVTAIENNKKYKLKNITPPSRQVFTLKDFNNLKGQWKVHEIIIDEAQDLKLETLKKIKTHADTISYGADFNQQLYEKTVNEKEIKNLFGKNIEYNLQQNFRNSYHILNFVKGILPNFHISQSTLDELKDENIGIKPIMFISNDFEKEIEKIIEIINEFKSNTHNIAILLPFGETNDYTKEQSVDKYYDELENKWISCSKYYNKMNTDDI